MEFIAKGKRSEVFKDYLNKKPIAIKKSKIKKVIDNEYKFLKLVNKEGIGPKLISKSKNYVSYEFVEGIYFSDYIKNKKFLKIKKIVIEILKQCRILDKLKINKLEFIRPLKHVFITKKGIKIIDFERCYFTEKPKNVSQFCSFLKNRFRVNLIKEIKEYKKTYKEKDFKKILEKFHSKT